MYRLRRRSLLRAGAFLGLSLADPLRGLRAEAATGGKDDPPEPRARSVIQIHLPGGLSHSESFDPKPFAPVDYRGEVKAIATKVDGLQFASHFAKTAKIADRLVVVHSMTHGEAAHERGTHNMLTGYRPSPAVVYPSMGSIVSHELGARGALPAYVAVPRPPSAYSGTGYLSATYAPFALGGEPSAKGFKVRDLDLPKDVDEERFARRRSLLDAINAGFSEGREVDGVDAMQSFYSRAYQLLASPEAKSAFRLDQEPGKVRDRYGRNNAGQRLLAARRLVEAGVRYVTVPLGGWDFHEGIAGRMRSAAPPVDTAFSSLILDLDERGLLDETLVLLTTEFGRTPKVNPRGGRDHWPGVFSVILAGGGLKRGHVHGSSDSTGSEVATKAVSPEDMARTLFTLVGVDPEKRLMAGAGRPLNIMRGGRILRDLMA